MSLQRAAETVAGTVDVTTRSSHSANSGADGSDGGGGAGGVSSGGGSAQRELDASLDAMFSEHGSLSHRDSVDLVEVSGVSDVLSHPEQHELTGGGRQLH